MNMPATTLYPRTSLPFSYALTIIALCLMLAMPLQAQPALQVSGLAPRLPGASPDALQFVSGDYLLRFEPRRASMMGLDHSLTVEFMGTQGVMPASTAAALPGEIQPLQQVSYAVLWPGVSARFSLAGGAIAKSEYIVAPGADPTDIRLRYSVPPVLQPDGSLAFTFSDVGGQLVESAPVAWQVVDGRQQAVQVAFHIYADGQVGYTVPAYDPRHALVIDPDYQWHTFYGGSATSEMVGACLAGNFYFGAGWTSNDIHRQNIDHSLSTYYHTGKDIVVTIQDAARYFRKVAHFGGSGDDFPSAIVCSGSNVYIVGASSSAWLGPNGQAPRQTYSGAHDIFVLSLSLSGTDMLYNWHTFYGSQDQDLGRGIAVNGSDLYVTGASYSDWDGPYNTNALHSHSGGSDLAVVKLDTSGNYTWHTFFGSQGEDLGAAVAANASVVWATGVSEATWRGPASANPIHAHSGGNDIAVLTLSSTGAYGWHTFYGSSGNETGSGVALHATSGAGFISAYGNATWQGDGDTAPLHAYTGGNDITVLALSSAGAYDWHTFYGSSNTDEARGLAIDVNNNLYVGGTSGAVWVGPAGAAPVSGYNGRHDMFLLRLNARGAYAWHSFFGGEGLDVAQGINIAGGAPLLSGSSSDGWLGPLDEQPLDDYLGGDSAVVVFAGTDGAYSDHVFMGTSSDEYASAIASDLNSNIILAGRAYGLWRGPGNQSPLHGFTGGYSDLFVLKLDSNAGYLWHTFYGGPKGESPDDVTTDTAGNIYVFGTAYATWNGPAGQAPVNAFSASGDFYVLKLDPNGAYQWHTFLGGASIDQAAEIVFLNATSSLYLTGYSLASWNGPGATAPRHAHTGGEDILVASLAASNAAYQWHTFYGTVEDENGYGIAASSSALFVTGYGPAWSGPSGQAPLHSHDGSSTNLFALKLTTAGNYSWHTFYGNVTYGSDLALDGSSNLYLLGRSTNDWLGPAGETPTHPHAQYASLVLKLNSSGAYQWHGFFGAENASQAENIALAQNGDIFAALEASEPWQAYGTVAPLNPFQGRRDAWLLRLTPQGMYRHHTYLGSEGLDYSAGLAITPHGLILVGGSGPKTWQYQGNPPLHAFNEVTEVSVTAFTPLEQVFLPVAVK